MWIVFCQVFGKNGSDGNAKTDGTCQVSEFEIGGFTPRQSRGVDSRKSGM